MIKRLYALAVVAAFVSGCGAGVAGSGGTADATPVFNYIGTVNGSTTAGPVASALGSTAP